MTTIILLVKASALLATALAAARLLERGSASTRHGLWSATFVALLAMPLLGSITPTLSVPVPASWQAAAPVPTDTALTSTMDSEVSRAAPPLAIGSPDTGLIGAPDGAAARHGIGRPASVSVSVVAGTIWLAGAAAALVVLGVSLVRVRRLSARAHATEAGPWRDALDRLATPLALGRVRLLFSDAVRTPMAGGVWRPVIFLPAEAEAWGDERRRIVLAHELSHLARRDPLRHLAARIALACYWFHPLAWLAARQSSLAREQACDEAVLSLGIRPSEYARVLLELAEGMCPARAIAALPMVERSLLERRLMAILDDNARPAGRRPRLAIAAAAFVTLTLAAAQPAVHATTTIVVPPAQPARGQAAPSISPDPRLTHFSGAVVIEGPMSTPQSGRQDCWTDTFGGSFRGSSVTVADIGGRPTIDEMIGVRNGDRVVQTHFGDLRVCMVAEGAVALERGKPSEWSAPRLLIEARRGGSTQQMEIRDGQQVTWRVNGTQRPVDAAAQQWRAAMFAVLDTTWELSTLRGDVSTLRGEISTVRGQESSLRGRISTLTGEVSTMRGRQSTIRGEESSLRGEISTIRGHVSSLAGQISSERGSISSLTAGRSDLSGADRDRVAAQVREHEAAIARIERELRDYNEDAKIAEVERRIETLDADRKAAEIDEEIRRFDLNAKIAGVEREIQDLNVDGKIAGIEKQIQALDADRRSRALEDRREDEVKRLEKAIAAIR